MSNLQIKDLPYEIHEELRRRASQAGMSVRDYVLDLIRRDQALPSRQDWLGSLRALPAVKTSRRPAELIREERKRRIRRGSRH
jgi:plasmid stability protein